MESSSFENPYPKLPYLKQRELGQNGPMCPNTKISAAFKSFGKIIENGNECLLLPGQQKTIYHYVHNIKSPISLDTEGLQARMALFMLMIIAKLQSM